MAGTSRTYHSSGRFDRGLAFFIGLFSKPKIVIRPILTSSMAHLGCNIEIANDGSSPVFETETTVTALGPTFAFPADSNEFKPIKSNAILIFTSNWEALNKKLRLPVKISKELFPRKKNRSEEEFNIFLFSMFKSPNEKSILVEMGAEFKMEEQNFGDKLKFLYMGSKQTTSDLLVIFEIYLKGRTKDNSPIQESKKFKLTVPNFGDPANCDLTLSTFKELKE